jgi:hypothetical protein
MFKRKAKKTKEVISDRSVDSLVQAISMECQVRNFGKPVRPEELSTYVLGQLVQFFSKNLSEYSTESVSDIQNALNRKVIALENKNNMLMEELKAAHRSGQFEQYLLQKLQS